MPTYDYKCDACGNQFERFQSITSSPVRKCPKCGKMKVRRLIGAGAGLIFKGSGFYITDYRSEGYKNAAKGDSASAETKPASDAKSSTDSTASSTTPASTTTPAKSDTPPAAASKRRGKK